MIGRTWAGAGPADQTELLRQLKERSAPVAIIEAIEKQAKPVDLLVWPNNREAYDVFLAIRTQWRTASSLAGIFYVGLDYNTLPIIWQAKHIPMERQGELFDALRVIEYGAVSAMNERRA